MQTKEYKNNTKSRGLSAKASYGLILTSGILWGCLGIFVRRLKTMGLESMEIVSLRAIVTVVFMFLFLLCFKRDLLKIKFKDLWCFLGTGLCSIVFFNYCYFSSINMTSMAVAAVLLYTAPAFVMVMSFFLFGEQITVKKVIALMMTFIGCVLVTGIAGASDQLSFGGIVIGLGAGFGYALYSIFSRFALDRGYHSLTITCYTFLFAVIGSSFFVDLGQLARVSLSSGGTFLFIVVFALCGTVIPYLTYTLGLQQVENGKASIIASIEPVTATIVGVLLYKETLSLTGLIGVILVLVALILCND